MHAWSWLADLWSSIDVLLYCLEIREEIQEKKKKGAYTSYVHGMRERNKVPARPLHMRAFNLICFFDGFPKHIYVNVWAGLKPAYLRARSSERKKKGRCDERPSFVQLSLTRPGSERSLCCSEKKRSSWQLTHARARCICWCAPGFRSTLSGPIGTAHSIVILITYSYSTAMALLLVKHCNNRQDREREDYQQCAPQCIWVRTYVLSLFTNIRYF
jgi:hypothetical protein